MKKVLAVVLILLVLIVGAAAAFVVTFDANRYKGLITDNLSKTLGRPVTIGRVGLGWRNGIAFMVSDLAVQAQGGGEPGLTLKSASAGVKLLPLLHKDVQFTSILLDKPYVTIDKLPDGSMLIGGIDLSKLASSAPSSPSQPASSASSAPLKLSIDSAAVRGGRVVFRDRSGASPMTVDVNDIDVTVKNFSLTGPFEFQAAASVFSAKQNFKITGTARLPKGGAPAGLQDFSAESDLADLDYQKLAAAFPSMGPLPFKEKPRGQLAVKIGRLDFDPASLGNARGEVTLKEGRIVVPETQIPLEHIDLAATIGGDEAVVDHLTMEVAGGAVRLSSKTTGLKALPVTTMHLAAQKVSLSEFMRGAAPGAPQLNGHVNIEMDAQAQGTAWPQISGSMNGRARLTMDDGVLLNYNLLNEVIQKLSIIPGAESAFKTNFPQMYQKRLEDRSTLLKPLDITANIVGGTFIFDSIQIDTEFALLNGSGQLGLDRRLSGRANLILNEEISRAIGGAVGALQVLYNNRGEIVLPVSLEGQLPQIKIVPDRQFLTQKLLSGQTQELVQDLVKDPAGGVSRIEDILKKNLKSLKI